MNNIDMNADAKGELETREGFDVQESDSDSLEVVELERAPLTDINFGF